jgi:uncharacterized membrane protein
MRHLPIDPLLLAGVVIAAIAGCSGADRDPDGRADPAAATSDTTRPPPSRRAAEPPSSPAAEPPAPVAYRALGTEPFWGLHIGPEELRFTTPDDPDGMRFTPAEPVRSGDTLRWTSAAAGASLDARIWPGECSDNMSDKVWTHASVVQIGATTYHGCAELQAAPDSAGG